jgi:adenylate cyclase
MLSDACAVSPAPAGRDRARAQEEVRQPRRLDDAVSLFSQAVQSNPRFSTLYIFQASALAHAGRADEAATAASRLLAMQPAFRVAPFRRFASGFCRKDMLDWLTAGLLKAGLPE